MAISNRLIQGAAVAAILSALGACASGDGAGDKAAGRDKPHIDYNPAADGLAYAREACASCHGVEAGQRSPKAAAPSFDALANRPGMNRAALSALLRSPHRNMPNLIVEPDRVDDLAAYLATLDND